LTPAALALSEAPFVDNLSLILKRDTIVNANSDIVSSISGRLRDTTSWARISQQRLRRACGGADVARLAEDTERRRGFLPMPSHEAPAPRGLCAFFLCLR